MNGLGTSFSSDFSAIKDLFILAAKPMYLRMNKKAREKEISDKKIWNIINRQIFYGNMFTACP